MDITFTKLRNGYYASIDTTFICFVSQPKYKLVYNYINKVGFTSLSDCYKRHKELGLYFNEKSID